jgi:hypothetical protein
MAKGAKVRVYGDWDGSAVKKAEKDLNSFGDNVKKGFATVGAAVAGAFALTEVTQFLKDATQAAIEDEKSMVSLAKAMENMGLAAQNAGVEQFVEQLMLATGVADDQLRPAMSRLLLVTGDVAESQRGLQLAMDIAAGTGRDLDSVTTALAKAYGGQTTALGRLGVGLDQATLKSKDMDLITAALSQKFEGQAAAAADTYGGRIQRLNVAVGEAQETIGYALLGALDRVTKRLGGADGFSGMITQAADKTATFTVGVGALVDELLRLGSVGADAANDNKGLVQTLQQMILNSPLAGRGLRDAANMVFMYGQATEAAAKRNQILQDAMEGVTNGVPRFIAALGGAEAGLKRFGQSAAAAGFDVAAFYGVNPSAQRAMAEARANVDSIVEKYNEADRATGSLGSTTKKATQSFSDLRKELLASIEDSPAERYAALVTQLKDNLRSAEQTFISFKDSVVSSITQAFSFGDAYQAAKDSGMTFLQALTDQANNAVAFADRIKQLVIAGLSPQALQQVLAAGVTAGTGIANQLIEGGATAIQETNRLVETTTAAAEEVAMLSASAYYGAGVKNAQDTLAGFAADLGPDGPSNKRMQRIMNDLAASLNRTSVITVITRYETQGAPPSVGSVAPARIPAMAEGGIVTGPTLALIGEAGPEAVVPLSRSGGMGTTINLTVNAGMGTDGGDVGRQIVDALRQYERRNGPVPITVR